MKRTRSTSWLAIMLSAAMVLSTVGCGGSGTNSGGSTTAAGGSQSAETTQAPAGTQSADATQSGGVTERKLYESTFKASGTDPETYNENISKIINNMMDYFAATGELDTKLTGYDEPITVTTALSYNAGMEDSMGYLAQAYGESMTYNRWQDIFKQVFNVDLVYSWQAEGTDYAETLRLEMASGELPDIFYVTSQSDLKALVDADLVWDLTDLYEEYATDILRMRYESDENVPLQMATFNGRLYALPNVLSATDTVSYIWLREDWMEKLNLEDPKTFEDLEGIMEAFKTQDPDGNGVDDTWGLGLTKNLEYYTRGIATGFGAYPGYWVTDKDGNAVYGGTTEETKQYLAFLADLYQKGYIDTEFVAYNDPEVNQQVLNEKVGLIYGGHWFISSVNSLHSTNPDYRWRCVQLPSVTGEKMKAVIAPNVGPYMVVNKNFDHPEIAIKLVSFLRGDAGNDVGYWLHYCTGVNKGPALVSSFVPIVMPVGGMSNLETYWNLMEAYESDDPESVLRDKAVSYWANLHSEDADARFAWERMFGPGEGSPISILDQMYKDGDIFYTSFYGVPDQLMQDNWSTITDQEWQIFTDIVIGNVSVDDGFQKWMDVFKSMKGDEITAYVNEWRNENVK